MPDSFLSSKQSQIGFRIVNHCTLVKDEKKVELMLATYFDNNSKCFPFTNKLELNF